ncbi:hypothetical protein D3C76_1515720 [compost metagenome]
MSGIEAEIIPDRGHDIGALNDLSLNLGCLNGLRNHKREDRFLLGIVRQALQESGDMTRFLCEGKQQVFHGRQIVAKVWPIGLLPVIHHETNIPPNRLISS